LCKKKKKERKKERKKEKKEKRKKERKRKKKKRKERKEKKRKAHLYSQHSGGRDRQIFINSRPAQSSQQVPGQPELHNKETLS